MMTRKKTFRKTHTSVVLLVLRVAVALALVGAMAGSCGGSANDTIRVSVNSSEAQADIWSDHPSISSDGRFVAFESEASNLVANDTNGFIDAFVHDLQTGATERVSVNSSGRQGNLESGFPSISSDGRFVAFQSLASDLVANDTNNTSDVFVRDLRTGTTQRVSVSSSEAQADNWSDHPSISSDGRFVAFESIATNLVAKDTNGSRDVFVRDRRGGNTERVSIDSSGKQGNLNSYRPSISSDGRFVAFESEASNLVANDTNSSRDVFVRELPDTTAP
jgi:Tol biopolymer transport system component